MMKHPGCVDGGEERRVYSDTFRRFVLDLREKHAGIDLPSFCEAIAMPLGTVEDWLRNAEAQLDLIPPKTPTFDSAIPRVETLLEAWKRWDGTFVGFCTHAQADLRIPYGRAEIARILEAHGVRLRRRRPGHEPDEKALRKAFETFFPGAQWVGDGTILSLTINGRTYTFNLELNVDCCTDALVGASLRKEEDAQAVIDAFKDAVETTGAPPIAELLDNKPANLTPEVLEALGETIRIRASLGRPQNKAHVEGKFGLFQQTAPDLQISADSDDDMAKEVLKLLVQIWARTLNHRPRRDHNGRSRVELYQSAPPTQEQIEQARAALLERHRKQELQEETRRARQDPLVRGLLDAAFARLRLDDPEGNIRAAIAGYPRDSVIAGLATFEGKWRAGTLPRGVDARYLLGIVRNIAHEDEGLKIADALLRTRIEVRDLAMSALQSSYDAIAGSGLGIDEQLKTVIDRASSSDRTIDRFFWIDAAARIINNDLAFNRPKLARQVARRIHTNYRMPHRERLAAVRRLIVKVIPLD
jgi:transposase InsO family protein